MRVALLALAVMLAPGVAAADERADDAVALVVLVEGHRFYIGNDTDPEYRDPELPERVIIEPTRGIHAALRDALAAPAGQPGWRGALLVYGAEVEVRLPMGPLARLNGDALGPQARSRGVFGRDLAAGLRAALAELRGVTAGRRVLFVISDGFGPQPVDDFHALRRQLDDAQIEVHAFRHQTRSHIAGDDEAKNEAVMRALGTYHAVAAAADLPAAVAAATAAIAAAPPPAAQDGAAPATPRKRWRWKLWLAIGLGGVVLAFATRLARRR